MDNSINIKNIFVANGGVVRTSTLREYGLYNQKLKTDDTSIWLPRCHKHYDRKYC